MRGTKSAGYEVNQRTHKRVEEIFGWMETVGILRKVKLRGQVLVDSLFRFGLAVYNLVRMRNPRRWPNDRTRGARGVDGWLTEGPADSQSGPSRLRLGQSEVDSKTVNRRFPAACQIPSARG